MGAMFKPVLYVGDEMKIYPTYQKLKSDLKNILPKCPDNKTTVFRKRRGEWGEWFEKWELQNGKPVKTKEGWM